MAVFGVQVVLTMIIASFLHKISPFYSFGRWLITFRLNRFVAPSDDLLRPHVSIANSSQKGKRKNATGAKLMTSNNGDISSSKDQLDPTLILPKSSKIKIPEVPVDYFNVNQLHYSSELEWILNLVLAAVSVFLITELYFFIQPDAMMDQYNLSTIWLMIASTYIFYVLGSLTQVYMSEELSHQRSVCLVFTMLFFVISLITLLIDEEILDLGLDKTYSNIVNCTTKLFERYSDGLFTEVQFFPMWAFKILLAFGACLLSYVLVFPGLRFADLHFNALRYTSSKIVKALLHTVYLSPFFCLSLWVRPLSSNMLTERNNVNLFGQFEVTYNNFRICLVLGVCVFRLALYTYYMQIYLNTAKWKIEEMKRESGRISVREYRSKITTIFLFYGGMGVQYLAPYLLLLCLVLLVFTSSRVNYDTIANLSAMNTDSKSNIFTASGFGLSVFFGCFTFFSWWLCLVQTVITGFGAVLREYL